jgi:hypothetical protein
MRGPHVVPNLNLMWGAVGGCIIFLGTPVGKGYSCGPLRLASLGTERHKFRDPS